MNKYLLLILLGFGSFAINASGISNIIESNCNIFWKGSQTDIDLCIKTWKEADSWSDVHAPSDANPSFLQNKKEETLIDKLPSNSISPIVPHGATSKQFSTSFKDEIKGFTFVLNTDPRQYLSFKSKDELKGQLRTINSGDKENWFETFDGAYEVKQFDETFVYLYSGQMQCTYQVNKRGQYYWFKKISANYSNICSDLLMMRVALIE